MSVRRNGCAKQISNKDQLASKMSIPCTNQVIRESNWAFFDASQSFEIGCSTLFYCGPKSVSDSSDCTGRLQNSLYSASNEQGVTYFGKQWSMEYSRKHIEANIQQHSLSGLQEKMDVWTLDALEVLETELHSNANRLP